jgi:formate dehydrogenase iron-sulfur subunit
MSIIFEAETKFGTPDRLSGNATGNLVANVIKRATNPLPNGGVQSVRNSTAEHSSSFVFEYDTPLDRYLAQQSDLTAVERFARLDHQVQNKAQSEMDKNGFQFGQGVDRVYRNLIPLVKPRPGEQYAFAVDLDTCTGCKACVTACHSLNGLDDDEAWRSVGLLHTARTEDNRKNLKAPQQQHVTTGCHHCVDPACLNGCPVDAYEKDPITGIVAHLDDQCIGCGYCTLTCPYEVPRYNAKRGIVRKCDMCAGRLAVGEAPACVQACPNEAISITVVEQDLVRAKSLITRLVPGAPHSLVTSPTTQYQSTRGLLNHMEPADLFALQPAQAHPPLAIMLVLTQLSVGAFVVDFLLQRFVSASIVSALQRYEAGFALAMGLIALGASVFHLGRPRYAFRVVIGFRHSWLSREAFAFGAFAATATAYAAVLWWPNSALRFAVVPLGASVAITGAVGVFCSIKIYVATQREWWAWRYTGTKFVLSAAICGVATALVTTSLASFVVGGEIPAIVSEAISRPLSLCLVGFSATKLLSELVFFHHSQTPEVTDRKRTALLMAGALRAISRARFILGVTGGLILPTLVWFFVKAEHLHPLWALFVSIAALVCATAGELAERYLYFRAVSIPRMPGAQA